MASSDDEDLKLAIALSLQGQQGTEVVDLDGKEDNKKKSMPPSSLGFLGIDRKKMEQERLSRRRKPSLSPPPARKRQKGLDVEDEEVLQQPTTNIPPSTSSDLNRQDLARHCFSKPTVKRTWAFGHPRAGDDIKLEEVFQKHDLNLAVLSSFQWDIEWLLAKINTKKTQITLVMQAKEQDTKEQYRRETADMRNLRLCFPSMVGQVNCMHSKLMLLSYPTLLRVVIPTANLVPYDWGESGDMENSVFLVDLPRLPSGQRRELNELTAFGRELVYFLKAMGLEASIIDSIPNFDFAATKDIAFVHTIGGAHMGDSWRRTGYCGLGRAVKELGLETDKALNIDFVTSSVGSLSLDFLSTIYLAAQGDDGLTEYGRRNPETGKGKSIRQQATLDRQRTMDEVSDNFLIYFPTHDTVKASTAGYAGTICFQSKWYNSPTFPRQCLRDCKSARAGLLMHNKILYVRRKAGGRAAGTCWAYVGSANCSESAWGRLSKDRVSKSPKLNCRNWECGVIVPVREDGEVDTRDGLTCFKDVVPVPMQYPGDPYGNREPWYYSEQ